MSIKICCTKEDSEKKYWASGFSMESDIENGYIYQHLHRFWLTSIPNNFDNVIPIICCPYCGAKIEEE